MQVKNIFVCVVEFLIFFSCDPPGVLQRSVVGRSSPPRGDVFLPRLLQALLSFSVVCLIRFRTYLGPIYLFLLFYVSLLEWDSLSYAYLISVLCKHITYFV